MEAMRRNWPVYARLAAVAVLLGPLSGVVYKEAADALASHALAVEALASFFAGMALLFARPRSARPRMTPDGSRAIWLLLVPHLLAVVIQLRLFAPLASFDLPWGTTTALGLAAPLWLALLAAAQLIDLEVPRGVAAAAIAGVVSVLLALPTSLYTIAPAQIPGFVVAAAQTILAVFTWCYAARRLGAVSPAEAAGRYLLLRTAIDGLFSLALERTSYHTVVWHQALGSLVLAAAVAGAAYALWFRLLETLPLPVFALLPLAVWTAQLASGLLLFGVLRWQMDFATAVAVAALWFGMRARDVDDQPVALELG